MPFQPIYYIAAGIGFLLVGAVEIWQKRCFFINKRQYTAASMKEFALHEGISMILMGVAVLSLVIEKYGQKLCLFFIIGSLFYYSVKMRSVLVKKKK